MKNKLFLSIILIIFLFVCCQNVFAVERPLEIDYPEIAGERPTTVQETLLPDFIKYLFNFSLIIVGLIAFAALIIGGFLYLISAGNPAALSDAKDRILGAIIGLVLLLCSWLILNTINPQLTIFYPIDLPEVSMYQGQPGSVTLFTEDHCDVIENIYPDCDNNEKCENGKKCFDIFKDGTTPKKCVDETKMINLTTSENLKRHQYGESDSWDDRAYALIFYGENKRVRACADPNLKECKILTEPNKCHWLRPLKNDVTGDNLGELEEGRLSSIEVFHTPEGARLYEEKNFGGAYQEFPAGINGYDCKSGSELSLIGENRASSLEVAPHYVSVFCKESNGDCGISTVSNHDLSGWGLDNTIAKICVVKIYTCGGVLIYEDPDTKGRNDFIPPGKPYQLADESWVREKTISSLRQWYGGCEIILYENAGLGGGCSTDDSCCGREWHYKFSKDPQKDETIANFGEKLATTCGCESDEDCDSCSYKPNYKYIFTTYSHPATSIYTDTCRCTDGTCCDCGCKDTIYYSHPYTGQVVCENCVDDKATCIEVRQ